MQNPGGNNPHHHHHYHHHHHHHPQSTPNELFQNRSFPPRFAGDGLDMRRPVTSTNTAPLQEPPMIPTNFIDLTGSDEVEVETENARTSNNERSHRHHQQRRSDHPARRMPRYPNEIFGAPEVIDLESSRSPEIQRRRAPAQEQIHEPTSPEIQFMGIQRRPDAPPPPVAPPRPASAAARPGLYLTPSSRRTYMCS